MTGFQKEVDAYLAKWVGNTITRLTDNLVSMRDSSGHNRYASGTTAQSIASEKPIYNITNKDGRLILTFYMPDYYDFINQGVQGLDASKNKAKSSPYRFKTTKPVPKQAVRKFMLHRGITPKNPKGDYNKSLDQMTYAIGVSIKQKGIAPVPFFDHALDQSWIEKLATELLSLYSEEALKNIDVKRA